MYSWIANLNPEAKSTCFHGVKSKDSPPAHLPPRWHGFRQNLKMWKENYTPSKKEIETPGKQTSRDRSIEWKHTKSLLLLEYLAQLYRMYSALKYKEANSGEEHAHCLDTQEPTKDFALGSLTGSLLSIYIFYKPELLMSIYRSWLEYQALLSM